MITAPLLSLIDDAGAGVLVLTDDVSAEEFARSRLTRAEVCRQLQAMALTLDGLPAAARAAMPEIDWAAWTRLARPQALSAAAPGEDDPAWFAARSLVPATLSWLRVYRRSEPALFEFRL